MVRENLIRNVSLDREPCRINTVITGIFSEIPCNAEEEIVPEEGKTNGGTLIKETAAREDGFCFLRFFKNPDGRGRISSETVFRESSRPLISLAS
jgi:hypothetical protein